MGFGKYKVFTILILALAFISFATPYAIGLIEGHETHTFESLSVVVFEGEQALSGVDALTLRYGIDAYGNNNSIVESLEVTNYEIMYEDYVRQYANEYTLNGIEGDFTDIVCTFKDVEGNANSSAPITFEYNGRVEFTSVIEGLDSYRYRVVSEGEDVENTMLFQLTVPDGYEITDTQGIIVPEFSSDRSTVGGSTLVDSNIIIDFGEVDEWAWLWTPLAIVAILSGIGVVVFLVLNHYTNIFSGPPEEQPPEEPEEAPAEEANTLVQDPQG